MNRESIAEDMESAGFPVIESLSNCVYGVGEIPFSTEWFPKGQFSGVIKEIKSAMDGYNIRFVYVPDFSTEHISVHLPPIELPSGFYATVFPKNVNLYNLHEGDGYNLICIFGTNPDSRKDVFPFDSGGEYLGMRGSKKRKGLVT